MHFAFIPYGKREWVEKVIRNMEAQKMPLSFTKGDQKINILVDGQVRVLPFGIYEYVFPKENLDAVLRELVIEKDHYKLGNVKMAFLRKMLKLNPIPEFDKSGNRFFWFDELTMNAVNIIPLGIREDGDMTEGSGKYEGWTHEAL